MKFFLLILFAHILLFFSCVSVPPGTGGTYMYNDFKSSHLIFNVPQGELTGTSSGFCYLSLVCIGDTTVSTAAKYVGIHTVTSVEYRYLSFFFFYSQTTIIVHGNKKDQDKR